MQFPSSCQRSCLAFGRSPAGPSYPEITLVDEALCAQDLKQCVAELMQAFGTHLKNLLLEIPNEQQTPTTMDSPKILRAPSEDGTSERRDRMSMTHRKRCIARAQKQTADVCVLLGDFERAATTYLNAQKQLRDLNDTMWIGGVMESYAACLEIQRQHTADSSTADNVVARYEEASRNYARVKEGTIPRIEAQFKLARFHISVRNKVEAARTLSHIFNGHPPLSEAENLQLYVAFTCDFQ